MKPLTLSSECEVRFLRHKTLSADLSTTTTTKQFILRPVHDHACPVNTDPYFHIARPLQEPGYVERKPVMLLSRQFI